MRLVVQRLEKTGWQMLPALAVMLMTLLSVVPLRVAGMTQMLSFLPLAALYYWGIFAPSTLPYSFLFVLGLGQDALTGTPLGLSSGINIAVMLLVGTLRRFMGQNLFGTLWRAFAAVLIAACMAQWSLMCLYEGRILSLIPQLTSVLVIWLLYPWLHLLFSRMERA